ncbi:MAG: molecular chaperone DnaJ [Candidatus Baltobacteraceae bacterium]
MPTKDYYDILGVPRGASGEAIKRAYRSLAREHHPDVSSDKAQAEHRFKEINEAYEVLSDPNKRAQYDRFGVAGNGASGAGDFGFGPGAFGDIFDMFFGNVRGAAQQHAAGPERGSDLRYDLEISLDDAFTGATREIVFGHLAQCDVCRGSGAKPGTVVVPCETCRATGTVRTVRHTPLGQMVTQSACSRCGGEGHIVREPCEACAGRGRRETDARLTVTIPAGVDDGSRIRIAGSGEAGARGGPTGDLYVYLRIEPHSLYRRDGRDTFIDVPVSFPEATLGATIEVPSLGGSVRVTMPPGTQSGTKMRLRGHGMPSVRGSSRGDHHVTVHVVVPTKLNKRQRELLEEYASAGGDGIDDRSFLERVKDAFRPE